MNSVSVLNSLKALLTASIGAPVELMALPVTFPFVTLTPADQTFAPARITTRRPYNATLYVNVICWEASMKSGADALERLENLMEDVIAVLLANKTLAGEVGQATLRSVKYETTERDRTFHVKATIVVQTEKDE